MARNYLISLNRSVARRAHMDAAFGRLDIDYELVPAIDGDLPSVREVAAACPTMTRGEIGSLMSHRFVWSLIARGSESHVAVFEDDIYLAPQLAAFLADWEWIPSDADIVKIDTMMTSANIDRQPSATRLGFKVSRLRSTHWGAAGYILSRKAAGTLTGLSREPKRPADAVLFDFDENESSSLVIYQVDPALCIQHDTIAGTDRTGSPLRSIVEKQRPARNSRSKTFISKLNREAARLRDKAARRMDGRVVRKKIPFAGGVPNMADFV